MTDEPTSAMKTHMPPTAADEMQRLLGVVQEQPSEVARLRQQLVEVEHQRDRAADDYERAMHRVGQLESQLAKRGEPDKRPAVATAPERIYLQISDDEEHYDEPFPEGLHDDVTWCADSVLACEVPYVRADLASPPAQRGEPVAWVSTLSDGTRVLDWNAQFDAPIKTPLYYLATSAQRGGG